MGAWVEIDIVTKAEVRDFVAPYVGAWVEIQKADMSGATWIESHPMWVRGLKFLDDC